MSKECILVADDEPLMIELIRATLEPDYEVHGVTSGAEVLSALETFRPELILLDVNMPEIDGYETCRRIRHSGFDDIPVVFVSGRDRLEDRLKGYEAGADDYLIKPVEPHELAHKVGALIRAYENRCQLRAAAKVAGQTAMTAMTNMGEMGVLLQALQDFNRETSLWCVAQMAAQSLSSYGLNGVVNIHTTSASLVVSTQGEATPIEISAVALVSGMGRIVEYKTRLSVSYPHITLLINNLPVQDPEKCGRLRDHLAVLAEAAEGRIQAIERETSVRLAIANSTRMLGEIGAAQKNAHLCTDAAIDTMRTELERAYTSVALSEAQEDMMTGILDRGFDRIKSFVMREFDIQHKMSGVVNELLSLSAQKETGGRPRPSNVENKSPSSCSA